MLYRYRYITQTHTGSLFLRYIFILLTGIYQTERNTRTGSSFKNLPPGINPEPKY